MSSGFIDGGTTEQPAERNELWMKAEAELAAARKSKEEQKNHDGKSLYEVLQANKAAKQEAFEESIKLKNQFRSLDEDDVNFLNSVRDADEAHQRVMREETETQLELFRNQQQQQQEPNHQVKLSDSPPTSIHKPSIEKDKGNVSWQATTRKRKKTQDSKILPGIKSIKLSSTRSPIEVKSANGNKVEISDLPSSSSQSSPEFNNVVPTAISSNDGGVSSSTIRGDSTEPAIEAPVAGEHSQKQVTYSSIRPGLLGYSSDED